jgi:hypothetical protein
MGVIPRKSGENFIITSDRIADEPPKGHAPKKTMTDVFQVWTGDGWSAMLPAAVVFSALDAADDYIRANYARIMA